MAKATANPRLLKIGGGEPIRVTLPASVSYDLKAFQKSLDTVATRLGCPACFSGADCLFQLEERLAINEKLEISPAVGGSGQTGGSRPVTASLPTSVTNDLSKIKLAVEKIAGRLGCPACCSGFDILLERERRFALDDKLNLR
jgi:hypothetical protein